MNLCEDRHEPKYLVTYKSAPGGVYKPTWFVCKSCMENKKHFGSDDLVESIKTI